MLYVIGIIVGALIAILGGLYLSFIVSNPGDRKVLNFVVAAGMIILGIYIISNTLNTKNVVDTAQQIINTLN